MKPIIEFIYSFNESMQEFTEFDLTPEAIESPWNLAQFATAGMSKDELNDLYKISCCIYGDFNPPAWFMECNGKLYFEGGKLIK